MEPRGASEPLKASFSMKDGVTNVNRSECWIQSFAAIYMGPFEVLRIRRRDEPGRIFCGRTSANAQTFQLHPMISAEYAKSPHLSDPKQPRRTDDPMRQLLLRKLAIVQVAHENHVILRISMSFDYSSMIKKTLLILLLTR